MLGVAKSGRSRAQEGAAERWGKGYGLEGRAEPGLEGYQEAEELQGCRGHLLGQRGQDGGSTMEQR